MKYWRIVAGHKKKGLDVVKSMQLGDWLRKGYVSLGHSEEYSGPIGRKMLEWFENDMRHGNKVAITTDGYLWAVGRILQDGMRYVPDRNPRQFRLYENRKKVEWDKVTRVPMSEFCEEVANKLKSEWALMQLHRSDWAEIEQVLVTF